MPFIQPDTLDKRAQCVFLAFENLAEVSAIERERSGDTDRIVRFGRLRNDFVDFISADGRSCGAEIKYSDHIVDALRVFYLNGLNND